MRVVDSLWFNNSRGTCGIILCVDELTKARVAYIGTADGRSEKTDTEAIMELGNKLSLETVQRIAAHFAVGKRRR